jgi:ferritin-like metal-binding protein YciE
MRWRVTDLKAWAEQLAMDEAAGLLEETLDEGKSADEKLSELALGGPNEEAEGEEGESSVRS